jgi:hypothetical protein
MDDPSVNVPVRPRGRPRKSPAELLRRGFQVRMRDQTRARIVEAARQNGRSLSEEIEYRLELSFQQQDVRDYIERYGDPLEGGVQIAALPIDAPGVLKELAKRLECPPIEAAKLWLGVYGTTLPYLHPAYVDERTIAALSVAQERAVAALMAAQQPEGA